MVSDALNRVKGGSFLHIRGSFAVIEIFPKAGNTCDRTYVYVHVLWSVPHECPGHRESVDQVVESWGRDCSRCGVSTAHATRRRRLIWHALRVGSRVANEGRKPTGGDRPEALPGRSARRSTRADNSARRRQEHMLRVNASQEAQDILNRSLVPNRHGAEVHGQRPLRFCNANRVCHRLGMSELQNDIRTARARKAPRTQQTEAASSALRCGDILLPPHWHSTQGGTFSNHAVRCRLFCIAHSRNSCRIK